MWRAPGVASMLGRAGWRRGAFSGAWAAEAHFSDAQGWTRLRSVRGRVRLPRQAARASLRSKCSGGALGLCSLVIPFLIGTTPFDLTVLLRIACTAERLVTSRDREFKSRKGRQNSRGKHATKHQRTRTEARGATPLWPSGEGARLLATPFAPQSRPAATAALCLASSSGRRACADSTTSPPFPALLLRHRHHITCRCQP